MSRALVFAAVGAAVVGAAVGYAIVRSRVPDLGPAGPNRDLAPDTLACYVEIGDGAGVWTRMRGTEAWNDLAASKLASAITEAAPVRDFLAALDQVATKAGYAIDARNAMKLVGRECSVGVELDPAGGEPRVLLLTKLDTAALSKDLLQGRTDLDALWTELQRRTGSCDFTVTASEHRGQKMATAARGAASYHAALLGDTLAVASDAALLRAAIDCRLDKGANSLGRRAAFQADMKALPAGAAVVEWYDLDALDAGRASLDAGVAAFTDKPVVADAIHAVLDGTKGAHTFGRATVLPEGDLYRLAWSYSKSSELFADRTSPAIAGLFPGDWTLYAEVHEIGAVIDAWRRSSLRRNLAAGELGKWFDDAMADPAKTVAGASHLLGRGLPFATAMSPVDEESPPAADEPKALLERFADRFSSRMGEHLAEQWLAGFAKGELVFAVDVGADAAADPRVAFAVRLDTEGRLLALAAEGAIEGEDGAKLTSEQCGSRRVWTLAREKPVHWTIAGDTLFGSTDVELVRAAARSDGRPAVLSERIASAVAGLKPGWRACAYYDMGAIVDRATKAAEASRGGGSRRGRRPEPGPLGADLGPIFDAYREMGIYGRSGAVGVYVPDDFASLEVRSHVLLAPAATDDGRALRAENSDAREPRCWASLPASTVAHGSMPAAGVRTIWVLLKSFATIAHADIASIESSFRDAMGMDLEKDLIPALGRELYMAVTYRPAPPASGGGDEPPVLPGILFGIEVKDPAVVHKALDRALELADEAIRESQGGPAQSPFVREAHEGTEVVRLVLPREEQTPIPIHPACALHDGFLLVSLDTDALIACIDAQKGKAPRLADSPPFAAATAELGHKCANFMLVDWERLADQVAVYAPMMGTGFAAEDLTYPDFPEDGDQAEWERRVSEYQKKLAAGRTAGADKARRWIDAFRVVEYVAASGTVAGDVNDSTLVVRFKK